MTKNPFVNALVAAGYVTLVASALFYVPGMLPPLNSVIVPIAFLSLFVFSAAVMGFLFFYEPARLLFEHEPKAAARLFLVTTIDFAAITAVVILVWYLLA